MGGKNSGHRKIPTAILKVEGTYREDRHGNRANEPTPTGHPEMPLTLSPAAKRHWKKVVPLLVKMGVAKTVDSAALAGMCEAWSMYQDIHRYYRRATVEDRLALVTKLIAARKDWGVQAGMFGMTPSDRARLQVERNEDVDDFDRLLA